MTTSQSISESYYREEKMMLSGTKKRIVYISCFFIACMVALFCLSPTGISSAATKQKGFSTAEDAVGALISALKDNNEEEMLAILGADAKELISSGDAVADREQRESFVEDYNRRNSLSEDGGKKVLVTGKQEWPFPIPLVKKDGRWFFDTGAGKEEILNRRIGRDELDTIQTMRAIVDAQREYAMGDRDGDGILEYAKKFRSDPGMKDGLFWETKEGEEPSPLGELVAKARAEGYAVKGSKEKGEPYHGYYYRMLTSQGKNANGGAFDYIVNGKMIGGFAVVAYPAEYGNSGVMTFIVNYDDMVYQKDLGKNTEKLAKNMKLYDPDETWTPVELRPASQ